MGNHAGRTSVADALPYDRRRKALDGGRAAQTEEGARARMSAIALDPLIAEAKRRARRRQLIVLAMGVVMLGAVAAYAIAHGGRPSAVPPRVSIPAGATRV